MGYYMRVLAESRVHLPVARLRRRLVEDGIPAAMDVVADPEIEDPEGDWNELYIVHPNGDNIALVTRSDIAESEVAAGDIEWFVEGLEETLPRSAADWLAGYLPNRVKVVYVFQLLTNTCPEAEEAYWSAVHAVQNELHATLGGVLHADDEGFSNRQGYQILWESPEDASGERNMAVLDDGGKWRAFTMDLGNPAHREAFLAGRVPESVSLL